MRRVQQPAPRPESDISAAEVRAAREAAVGLVLVAALWEQPAFRRQVVDVADGRASAARLAARYIRQDRRGRRETIADLLERAARAYEGRLRPGWTAGRTATGDPRELRQPQLEAAERAAHRALLACCTVTAWREYPALGSPNYRPDLRPYLEAARRIARRGAGVCVGIEGGCRSSGGHARLDDAGRCSACEEELRRRVRDMGKRGTAWRRALERREVDLEFQLWRELESAPLAPLAGPLVAIEREEAEWDDSGREALAFTTRARARRLRGRPAPPRARPDAPAPGVTWEAERRRRAWHAKVAALRQKRRARELRLGLGHFADAGWLAPFRAPVVPPPDRDRGT